MRTVSPRLWSRLRLSSLIGCALIGMSALMNPLSNRSARSLSPSGAVTGQTLLAGVSNMSGASALPGPPPGKAANIHPSVITKAMETFARSPLSFEPHGQTSGAFFSLGQGYNLYLTPQEASLTLRQTRGHQYPPTRRQIMTSREDYDPPRIESQSLTLKLRLIDANPSSHADALNPLPGKRKIR